MGVWPVSSSPRQIPIEFPQSASFAREDFMVSGCNREALAWIDRWPQWPAPFLIVHGPAGSGKSHLSAIWSAQANMDAIDDADAMIGTRETEEKLFHHYNRFREQNLPTLVTMTHPPALLSFVLPDLASRLRSVPLVALDLPDESLLRMILVKLFADRQMRIDADVIEYAVARMERSFDSARTLVAKLDQMSLALKKPVTIALLRSLFNPQQDDMFA